MMLACFVRVSRAKRWEMTGPVNVGQSWLLKVLINVDFGSTRLRSEVRVL